MNNRDKNSFHLYLSSGDLNPYSQRNTPTFFTTPLSTPLNLPRDQDWRVAISPTAPIASQFNSVRSYE